MTNPMTTVQVMELLQWAIKLNRTIVINYQSLSGDKTERTILPYLLKKGKENEIIEAFCCTRKEPRNFIIKNIEHAHINIVGF